jgi:hypothetical protein
MRLLAMLIVASLTGIWSPVAQAAEWRIGCPNLVCMAVNAEGNVIYLGQNGENAGSGQLPGAKPVGALSVGCSAATISGRSGERCEIVDGSGNIWYGPPRPTPNDPLTRSTNSLPK